MRTSLSTKLLVMLVVIASLTVLLWAPVAVGFGLAIAAAVAWCVWLERHPAT